MSVFIFQRATKEKKIEHFIERREKSSNGRRKSWESAIIDELIWNFDFFFFLYKQQVEENKIVLNQVEE